MTHLRILFPVLLSACFFGAGGSSATDTGDTASSHPALDASCFEVPSHDLYEHRYLDGSLPSVADGSVTQDCEVHIVASGEISYEYTESYDGCGRVAERLWTDGGHQIMRHETVAGEHTVWHDYDGDGVDDGTTVYTYDALDQLATEVSTDLATGVQRTFTYTYDADGQLTLRHDSDDVATEAYLHTFAGATHTVTTDEGVDGAIDYILQTTPTATGREILKGWGTLDYRKVITVDADGRDVLREHSDAATGEVQGTDTFTHDTFGRLTQSINDQPGQAPIVIDYTWTCPW